MTNRIFALTVHLEKEVREDDVQGLIDAIRHMRRVLKVEKHVADVTYYSTLEQVSFDLRKKLFDVLNPGWTPPK